MNIEYFLPWARKGLRPGTYDIYIDQITSEGAIINVEKEKLLRIVLIKKTIWNDLLKILPKGSLIRKIIQVR